MFKYHTCISLCSYIIVKSDEFEQSIEFPGGRVGFTTQMKFISEATDKRVPCYRVLDDDGYPIAGSRFEQVYIV